MKLTRKEVYERIDGERDYQDERHAGISKDNPHSDENRSISDWINYIEYHLNEAKECIYFLNERGAMKHVRKLTALGVACMEHKGVEPRIGRLEFLVRLKKAEKLAKKLGVQAVETVGNTDDPEQELRELEFCLKDIQKHKKEETEQVDGNKVIPLKRGSIKGKKNEKNI